MKRLLDKIVCSAIYSLQGAATRKNARVGRGQKFKFVLQIIRMKGRAIFILKTSSKLGMIAAARDILCLNFSDDAFVGSVGG